MKGNCPNTGKDIEMPYSMFGDYKKILKCPECGEVVFNMGDVLYHGA